uniref:Zinc finger BED domain-containing protein 5 n=1 Tax=Cacopsylla melanoneura TaxID=428564 RepID=A0A8D8UUY3_9HEMI
MKKDSSVQSANAVVRYVKDDNEKNTEASFRLAYNIAQAGKPHTIAETLIKPSIIEVVSCVLGIDAAKKIEAVQCSNNIISDRIQKISDHIEDESVRRLRESDFFALQMDESTDVAGLSILLVFARYRHTNTIHEGLLLCKSLELHTTGEEIFELIDKYFKCHNIPWEKCADVCTDGAAAMVGKMKGVTSRIIEVNPNCTRSHCILHRHALATKKLSPDFKSVLDVAVQCVNFIKARPLQTRLFQNFCQEMGSDHHNLLLHTEIRWLSRGKVLDRLFELREEVKLFLEEQKKPKLSEWFHDEDWLLKLAYLTDMFTKLNETNLSLQGKNITIFQARDKIKALIKKLDFWIQCVEEDDFSCFPRLNQFLVENEVTATLHQDKIKEHLKSLKSELTKYFPNFTEDSEDAWIRDPFTVEKKPKSLRAIDYELLLEIKCSSDLQTRFNSMKIADFWISIVLLPFSTTYLCETGFSAYTRTKDVFRNKLNAAPDIRIQLSDITPDLTAVMKGSMQKYHSSHH